MSREFFENYLCERTTKERDVHVDKKQIDHAPE